MENPSFYLESVVKDKNEMQDFEGPLSLILMLLSKNRIEIRDIKIADILDQYLDYLAQMESMDLEIASEFVQMAAHLLYIKTRTLLSGDPEEVSELEVLMQSLEQLKAKDTAASIAAVLPELKMAADYGLLYHTKPQEPLPAKNMEYRYVHAPADLLKALAAIYSRGARTPESVIDERAIPKRVIYSVRDKCRQIIDRLRSGSATLNELYSACTTRTEIVATFLSVLELCSSGSIFISRAGEEYEVSFTGGDVDNIIDQIVE